jgi:Fic family protein
MYIWQQQAWPMFESDATLIDSRLAQVLVLQQQLLGRAAALPEGLDAQAELDARVQSAIKSSQIEGESLNVGSVRSSVARQLGLEQAGLAKAARYEASVAMLLSAVNDLETPLSSKLICQWQAALFPEPPLLRPIAIGASRDDADGPMQVVSERRGKTDTF